MAHVVIPLLISPDAFPPILATSVWQLGAGAACVTVPEAPVNEDYLSTSWKHYVWRTWQVLPVKSISVAPSEEHAPHDHLGSRIALAYLPHPKGNGCCLFVHWRNRS